MAHVQTYYSFIPQNLYSGYVGEFKVSDLAYAYSFLAQV